MERLTFEGCFCDIAKCLETPGGSFCENGMCNQRKVWERLKAYEDTGLTPEQVKTMAESRRGHGRKQTRPVVRVDDETGEVVRFHSVREAQDSIGGISINLYLLTNRPLKGYRFYYEEEWKGGSGRCAYEGGSSRVEEG